MSNEAAVKAYEELRMPTVGDHIIYTDEVGNDHNALVQCVWGKTCLNFTFISPDEKRTDNYGRQIEHKTSMQHVSCMKVHGYYWRWPGEEKNPYVPPVEK
jgi:hypothetical protein